MADQLIPDIPTLLDANGEPLALGSVTFYETGTTTLVSIYSDEAGTVPLSNPVDLDAAGRAPQVFYDSSTAVKALIKDSLGATVRTLDPIQRAAQQASAAGSVSFNPVTNNTATNVQDAIEANADAIALSRIGRQRLKNGQFNLWTYGTSQTSDGIGSADAWRLQSTGSTFTFSQQSFTIGQTDVPGEPEFYARTVVVTAAGASNYVRQTQRIPSVRTFAGQTVSFQLYGKADTSRNIAFELVQHFGSGGSSDVTAIGAQKIALTSSWAKNTISVEVPSISGKTIGSGDYLELIIWFDAGSSFDARTGTLGQQSGTFDLSLLQLEKGSSVSPFEYRSKEQAFAETHGFADDGTFEARATTAATDTATPVLALNSQSTGTPAAGIGAGMSFKVETAAGNTETGAVIEAVATGVTAASEDFDLVVKLMAAGAAASEVMRIDSSGNLRVNRTASAGSFYLQVVNDSSSANAVHLENASGSDRGILTLKHDYATSSTTGNMCLFTNSTGGVAGRIDSNDTSTTYGTSSDYRLKEDVQPMTGASERLLALKPVNFAWKSGGSRVDGFLAHEAQAVVPEAVTGEKDAVDEDGNPDYQAIDQSKLVPLLTAALQEALNKIDDLETRLSALEAK